MGWSLGPASPNSSHCEMYDLRVASGWRVGVLPFLGKGSREPRGGEAVIRADSLTNYFLKECLRP